VSKYEDTIKNATNCKSKLFSLSINKNLEQEAQKRINYDFTPVLSTPFSGLIMGPAVYSNPIYDSLCLIGKSVGKFIAKKKESSRVCRINKKFNLLKKNETTRFQDSLQSVLEASGQVLSQKIS
jgi:hypothetical protein